MSITIYVPQDAVALGLGANRVARALFKGAEAAASMSASSAPAPAGCCGWNRWSRSAR